MKKPLITLLAATTISASAMAGAAFASSDDKAEVALFQKAQHDIAAGIKAAEAASGGKAVGAEFRDKDGAAVWEVNTVVGTKLTEIRVDAATGKVIATEEKAEDGDSDGAVTPEMLGAPLGELVTKAEAAGQGKVMSIKGEHEDGKYAGAEVEIVKADGSVHDFILNAADGKLTPAVKGQDDSGEAGESNG